MPCSVRRVHFVLVNLVLTVQTTAMKITAIHTREERREKNKLKGTKASAETKILPRTTFKVNINRSRYLFFSFFFMWTIVIDLHYTQNECFSVRLLFHNQLLSKCVHSIPDRAPDNGSLIYISFSFLFFLLSHTIVHLPSGHPRPLFRPLSPEPIF